MRTNRDSEAWRTIVEDWKSSGLTLREYCEGRPVSRSRLSWWARHFGYGQRRPVACPPPAPSTDASSTSACDKATAQLAVLVVEVPGTCVLRFLVEPAPEYLRAVVTALAGCQSEEKAGVRE